uniref:Solute carrier family 35 member B4 n=1 Tax=Astyanax mexicanus TaxID=7994 RepID=A0A8B9L5N9_ASTMX
MNTAFAVSLVFAGCCSNVVFLELLVRKFPGCGNIVTFAQFAFIALEGFVFQTNFGRKKPAIPISNYVIMVTMFFTVSVINNYALNFNIAMPLHMIFRSGSLIANMILGIIILKKRYSASKYLSIVLVSIGIFICTIMSAKQVSAQKGSTEEDGVYAFLQWLVGICMLTFALLMSARMGIFQETLYKQYGKHSKEALFYNHCLPLPGFLLLSTNIYNHAVFFSQSTPVEIPVIGQHVPVMWVYLLMNVITQYVCIRGVFILTTECTSLTVTLVVTLQGPADRRFTHNMGGNSSSRLEDEEVITVVKGIRLTDRVIDRMKESPKAAKQRPQSNKQAHPPLNLGVPWSPTEPLGHILPHHPSYASSLVTPPLQVPVPFASVSQETPAPPPPAAPSTVPTVEAVLSSPSSQESAATSQHTDSLRGTTAVPAGTGVTPPSSHDESIVPPATTESTAVPVEPFPTNTLAEAIAASKTPSPDAPFTAPAPVPPPPVTAESVEELAPPQSSSTLVLPSELPFMGQRGPTPTEETSAPQASAPTAEPDVLSMLTPLTDTLTPLASPSSPQAVVNEEELRKQIRDELQKQLEEEMKTAKLKIQQQLEEEKAKAEAEAGAKAQLQIQAEVQKVLEGEQQALQQSLKDAIMQERMNTEDERLVAQYYIQKVEEREKQLEKQDILYRNQITKLEEKVRNNISLAHTTSLFSNQSNESSIRFNNQHTGNILMLLVYVFHCSPYVHGLTWIPVSLSHHADCTVHQSYSRKLQKGFGGHSQSLQVSQP